MSDRLSPAHPPQGSTPAPAPPTPAPAGSSSRALWLALAVFVLLVVGMGVVHEQVHDSGTAMEWVYPVIAGSVAGCSLFGVLRKLPRWVLLLIVCAGVVLSVAVQWALYTEASLWEVVGPDLPEYDTDLFETPDTGPISPALAGLLATLWPLLPVFLGCVFGGVAAVVCGRPPAAAPADLSAHPPATDQRAVAARLEEEGYEMRVRPARQVLRAPGTTWHKGAVISGMVAVVLFSIAQMVVPPLLGVFAMFFTFPPLAALVACGLLFACGRLGYRTMTTLAVLGAVPLLIQLVVFADGAVGPIIYLPGLIDGVFMLMLYVGLLGLHVLFWTPRLRARDAVRDTTRAESQDASPAAAGTTPAALGAQPSAPQAAGARTPSDLLTGDVRVWFARPQQLPLWSKDFFRRGAQVPVGLVGVFSSLVQVSLLFIFLMMLQLPLGDPLVLAPAVLLAGWALWSQPRTVVVRTTVVAGISWVLVYALQLVLFFTDALFAEGGVFGVLNLVVYVGATVSQTLLLAGGVVWWKRSRVPEWVWEARAYAQYQADAQRHAAGGARAGAARG
ncbi:hypothetical protein C1Y63_01055 [Corynebacterium sp. 13CS0277]|uniref:hypothetical protein n=1 Tax=Corynebacterium sp. 13CS0277 TaxID=2071994 RepID=UPI000D03FD94|nr:hypothetical protein [Corynebacterium sp. 13CS0277]PRQ12410.1 hypothetical protein C1Y63_01055 [Corynebacterium sp. 13CS0277]